MVTLSHVQDEIYQYNQLQMPAHSVKTPLSAMYLNAPVSD